MLKLKLATGERFEIAASAINIVEEAPGDQKGCIIAYDIGEGVTDAALSDQYGFVRKAVLDVRGIVNPIEVTRVDQEGGTNLVTFSRDRIIARLEVRDSPTGVNVRLHVASGEGSFRIDVADTLDQLDGVESPAVRKSKRRLTPKNQGE
ncbi:MAG: hypothetical protein AB7E60_01885 [Sphingobium sp.]